jgi:integrase/recombinase XerC
VRAYVATAHRLIDFLELHLGGAVDAAALGAVAGRPARLPRRPPAAGLGNASAARELSAVRAFLAFAAEETGGRLPCRSSRAPSSSATCRGRSLPDDVVALAEETEASASEPWIGARDLAVLLLLYGAGLRVGEALGLTGAALPLGDVLSVTGKRAKTRMVPLLPQVRAAIGRYLELCPYAPSRTSPCSAARAAGLSTARWCAAPSATPGAPWGLASAPRRTRCGTASPPTCWAAARTCARSRNCSATPACHRPRSTPPSTPRTCSTSTATLTRAPERSAGGRLHWIWRQT